MEFFVKYVDKSLPRRQTFERKLDSEDSISQKFVRKNWDVHSIP